MSDDSGTDAGGDPESFDQHGCDHMEYGPPVAVTAAASGEDAPMIVTGHRRTDITLVDVGGDNGGTAMLHVDVTEPVSLYLDNDVGLTVMQNGAAVAPTDTAANALCPDQIAYRAVFALEAGMAMLTFGPTSEAEVRLVARAAVDDEGGHSHDGGHVHDGGHGHAHDGGHGHAHDAGHGHMHDAGHGHMHDAGHGHMHDAGHGHMHDAGHGHMHDAG